MAFEIDGLEQVPPARDRDGVEVPFVVALGEEPNRR